MSDEEQNAKKQKKLDENKAKERTMWEKLDELNKKFKDIKKHEKQEEKKNVCNGCLADTAVPDSEQQIYFSIFINSGQV